HSAHPWCLRPLVCLAIYGIGPIAGGDQYLVSGHGGHPVPVGGTAQSLSPDLYSLFCQSPVVSPMALSAAGSGESIRGHPDLVCALSRGYRCAGGYCVLERGPLLCLHGVSWGIQPRQASPPFSHGLLPDDGAGRGVRRRFCRGDSSTCL